MKAEVNLEQNQRKENEEYSPLLFSEKSIGGYRGGRKCTTRGEDRGRPGYNRGIRMKNIHPCGFRGSKLWG